MKFATTAIWVLALCPVLIASNVLFEIRWQSPQEVLAVLGRLAGVAGLSFLLVAACLSSRVPGFDRFFGGLTKLWHTHHLLGAGAFLTLLAHPLLLALARGESATAAAEVLFPMDAPWALWAGWVGLLLMMAFLGPSFSFFDKPPYQRWKTVHLLAGPAILFSLAHTLAYDRAIPPPWDYLVWGSLAALAVAALAYRWLFSRWQLPGTGGRFAYRVAEVATICQGVAEISFTPVSRALDYRSGQFAYLTPFDNSLSAGYGEEHPFTISSAPTENHLRMVVKDLGDASRALQHICVGSDVRIEGPYGDFFQETGADELWIGGGIGITPFLGRARQLRDDGTDVKVCLIFCAQDESRALFHDELTAITAALPRFTFQMHYFYKEGPLNQAFIESHCEAPQARNVYVCGPTPLLSIARSIATGCGVAARNIHTEEFNLL